VFYRREINRIKQSLSDIVADYGEGKKKNRKMADVGKVFVDRREAGIELGKMLEKKYRDKNVLVLGIPRGGIVVAHEVAKMLHGELSAVITKKLPHPLQQELAIGAAAEDGSVYLTALARNVNKHDVERILDEQKTEIQSRIQRFRNGRPLPQIRNRLVIITDDGIATGSTIVPAIKLCKQEHAAKVIVAAPVSGERYVSDIDELADEVVITERPKVFLSVGQV
jgi:putative phosphoribosyl transferase